MRYERLVETRARRVGLVAVGGMVGTWFRVMFSGLIDDTFTLPSQFPLGILVVNLIGAFALGLLVGWIVAAQKGEIDQSKLQKAEALRLLVGTGVLGGYTTYSGFVVLGVTLSESGFALIGAIYLLVTLCVGLVCSVCGWVLGAWIGARRIGESSASRNDRAVGAREVRR